GSSLIIGSLCFFLFFHQFEAFGQMGLDQINFLGNRTLYLSISVGQSQETVPDQRKIVFEIELFPYFIDVLRRSIGHIGHIVDQGFLIKRKLHQIFENLSECLDVFLILLLLSSLHLLLHGFRHLLHFLPGLLLFLTCLLGRAGLHLLHAFILVLFDLFGRSLGIIHIDRLLERLILFKQLFQFFAYFFKFIIYFFLLLHLLLRRLIAGFIFTGLFSGLLFRRIFFILF